MFQVCHKKARNTQNHLCLCGDIVLLLRFTFSTCDFDLFDNSLREFRRGVVAIKGGNLSGGENDSGAAAGKLVSESVGEKRTVNFDENVRDILLSRGVDNRHLPGIELW